MNPDQLPKQFCDNINISRNEEYFLFQMFSGTSNVVFALSPAHVKRLQIALTYYVTEHEKEYGAIAAEWPPKVTSPIQPYDLPAAKAPRKKPKEQ